MAADLDGDGKIDLFVANDTTANYFFRNRGGCRFSEEGLESGLATNAGGGYLAGMGVACGDFDGDGRLDLAVTNFFNESTTLYHNHGGGIFSDRSTAAGLAASTRQVLGFGLAALDANNDGRLDLVQANGHVDDYRPEIPYAMPAQLFLGDGAGKLLDVSNRAGPPWQVLRLGRGLAVGDLDNDGRIDMLVRRARTPRWPCCTIKMRPRTISSCSRSREPPRTATPSAPGGRHRFGSNPGLDAVRRRQLSVRPVTSVFTSDWDRRGWSIASRSHGPRAAATAIKAWVRTPGTACARGTRPPNRWPASLSRPQSREDRSVFLMQG